MAIAVGWQAVTLVVSTGAVLTALEMRRWAFAALDMLIEWVISDGCMANR